MCISLYIYVHTYTIPKTQIDSVMSWGMEDYFPLQISCVQGLRYFGGLSLYLMVISLREVTIFLGNYIYIYIANESLSLHWIERSLQPKHDRITTLQTGAW